ncbi:MAG: hypothetical protein Q9202_005441 [Teloschistes flavicans]
MATAGPELPPHLLAKRKRLEETEAEIPPKILQPHPRSSNPSPISSNADDCKRRRTIGPAPPPAPLTERPTEESTTPPPPPDKTSNSNSNSDNDDFGPSLPPSTTLPTTSQTTPPTSPRPATSTSSPPKPHREEWMLVPPSQESWTTRLDPTKLRNRKFATGKAAAAKPSPSATETLWTESPQQKQKRLADEMMGVRQPAAAAQPAREEGEAEREERMENERRIREAVERERGGALYEGHGRKKGDAGREKEDDPSARAFDKEKDMGGGVKIGYKQRQEMLGRAREFGGRFAGGKFL